MRFRSWGAPRALVASALLALSALTVVAVGSAAPTPEASGTEGIVDVQWTPLGLRNEQATVVVQLADKPVTVVEADTAGSLTKAEESAIEADLKGKQNALRGDIQALGGQVLADYQYAYNGVKVKIDRKQLGKLAALKGVTGVRGLQIVKPDNVKGVQLIGAPSVWGGLAGLHGENIKVAIIDTGLDFTHANFGGPGTVATYNAAELVDTLPPSVAHGWGMRVKGGIDLVGDAYDASADDGSPALIPHPDPNPLDCNGHGSHVGGSAAGSGVTSAGATYNGAYTTTTITGNSWRIAPGVAPKADLYGVRVFGCAGSTDVTVDAIEWSVANDMDVINMSLGSPFGSADDPSAVASTNAAKAGVIVVTSAGNSGPSQYITGSPGTGEGAISTAATDPSPSFPAATITIPSGPMTAVNANEFNLPPDGHVHGQDDRRRPGHGHRGRVARLQRRRRSAARCPPNTMAVVNRGVCARVAKAIFGQQAGADAVVMVNNSDALCRRSRVRSPRTRTTARRSSSRSRSWASVAFRRRQASDGDRLRAANGQSATVTPASITNDELQGLRELLLGRPAHGRQRPEAEHLGSGRVDRLDRRRHRQRCGDDLGHLDGLAARGGRRRTDAAGASVLERRGHQGRDHEHR